MSSTRFCSPLLVVVNIMDVPVGSGRPIMTERGIDLHFSLLGLWASSGEG